MSKIRSKNTKLEIAMLKLLREAGIPFKMHPKINGKPDFLVGEKIAIFCDSGFWHGRHWMKLRNQLQAGSNPTYWVNHIARNRRRDRLVNRTLRKEGFVVIRMWDEDILKRPEECVSAVRRLMRHSGSA